MKAVDEPALRAELLIPVQGRLAKWKRVQQFVANLWKSRALDSATITVARRAADGGYRLIKPPAFAAAPGGSVGPFTRITTNLAGGDAVAFTGGEVDVALSIADNSVEGTTSSFILAAFDATLPPNFCLCVSVKIHFEGEDYEYQSPDPSVADFPQIAPRPVVKEPEWQLVQVFDLTATQPASVRPFVLDGALNWSATEGQYYLVIAMRDNAGVLHVLWHPGRPMNIIIQRDGFLALKAF